MHEKGPRFWRGIGAPSIREAHLRRTRAGKIRAFWRDTPPAPDEPPLLTTARDDLAFLLDEGERWFIQAKVEHGYGKLFHGGKRKASQVANTLAAENRALRAEIARLREALGQEGFDAGANYVPIPSATFSPSITPDYPELGLHIGKKEQP